jgi:hypothetical protein
MPPEMEIVQSKPIGSSTTFVTQTPPPPVAGQTMVTPIKPVPSSTVVTSTTVVSSPTVVTPPTVVPPSPYSSSHTWPPAFVGQTLVDGGPMATPSPYAEANAKAPSSKPPENGTIIVNKPAIEIVNKPAIEIVNKPAIEIVNKPVVEKAAPTDWHLSWGKPDASKTPEAVKTEPVKKETVKTDKTEVKFDKIDAKSDKTKVAQAKATMPDPEVKKPDPLKNPDSYTRKAEDKDKGKSDTLTASASTTSVAPPPRPYTPAESPAAAPPNSPSMVGTQSVVSSGGTQYVPVPIVTVPDYRHPPQPPQANVPQAPQLNLQVNGNAFGQQVPVTPPPEGSGQPINAFSSMQPAQAPAAPEGPPQNAFGNMPMGQPMGQPMMPPQYGPAPQRTMLPPGPYTPLPSPGFHQPYPTPPGMPMAPAGYQMLPPQAPVAPAINPVSYQAAMVSRPAPTMPASNSTGVDPATLQLVQQLRDSFLPSEREMAAVKLSKLDWKANEPVVQALVSSASQDPAATVRASCVRSLAKMKCNTMPVVAALQNLKGDADPRVQQEVEQALAMLAPGVTGGQGLSAPSSVVPASASVPVKPN